jgi:prenylcysteine oxidase/farnesylcysteine lyase
MAILTTNSTSVPFNSIGVRQILNDGVRTITKIFSPQRMEDALLKTMYTGIERVDRYEWDSYPVLVPTPSEASLGFPDIELDKGGPLLIGENGDGRGTGVVEMFGGVYHVNAFEGAISTMESEVVAARNVVELMLRRWRGEAAADE